MLNNLVRMLFASPYLLGLFVKLQVFIWFKFEVFWFFFVTYMKPCLVCYQY